MNQEIGILAGKIWHTLEAKGEMSVAALKKAVGSREPAADWAIGWLAREEKSSSARNAIPLRSRYDNIGSGDGRGAGTIKSGMGLALNKTRKGAAIQRAQRVEFFRRALS